MDVDRGAAREILMKKVALRFHSLDELSFTVQGCLMGEIIVLEFERRDRMVLY